MATIYNVLGLICLLIFGSFPELSGHILTKRGASNAQVKVSVAAQQEAATIIAIAKSQIGVREATGRNDGLQVEKYLAYTGNTKGDAWCASFVSWVFGQAGYAQPRSAWSPALLPHTKRLATAQPAAVFGIYFPEKGRIAHVGIVERVQGNWVYAIEGNTNVVGSREGDGVYRKLRHTKTIKAYANWLPEQKGVVK